MILKVKLELHLMAIEINSTWTIEDVEGHESGEYRVLSIIGSVSSLIIFRMSDKAKINRPTLIPVKDFVYAQNDSRIKRIEVPPPPHLLVSEKDIPEKHKITRDSRYLKIQTLIGDDDFLFDLATSKNVKTVSIHAKKLQIDNKSIYRLLNLFWKNGQTKNALLPNFALCGGKGNIKKNVRYSLGTKLPSRTGSFERPPSYIVKEDDRNQFVKALKKYHLKVNGLNYSETYKNLLRTSYQDQFTNEEIEYPSVPSYRQFVNWSKKLVSKEEKIRWSTSESDYLRNKRGVEASLTDKMPVPGSCFEIDATVADVHIVSEFRRNHVIGRPTIYSVIDRASRLIVGFHVSLYYASWDAARQALVTAFTPKKSFCSQYDIDIEESDWPSCHIPQRLICDNGEMIGLKPEDLVVPLTELQIAPPYRPDVKGMIENRFDYINRKSLHRLLGSSRGGKIVRGSPDPRKTAVYTLKEVTSIMLRDVIEHNNQIFDDLATSSTLLLEHDLAPTPVNFWNIHVKMHKHSLKTATIDEINARLLPEAQVSMTRSGVSFNGMYYSCQEIRDKNLTSVARINGRIKFQARINQDDTSYIFVKLNENSGFIRCDVLDRSRELKNVPVADVLFIHDWLDSKKRRSPITKSSIENLEHKEKMHKNAVKLSKEAPSLETKGERVLNTKKRRQQEKELTKAEENQEISSRSREIMETDKKRKSKVIRLPRRTKED